MTWIEFAICLFIISTVVQLGLILRALDRIERLLAQRPRP